VFVGTFDELTVLEAGAGADEGDEMGCVDGAPAGWAASMSLNAIASLAARQDLARLVVAVAHDEPVTLVVDQRRTRRRTVIARNRVRHYGEHRRTFPTDAPTSALIRSASDFQIFLGKVPLHVTSPRTIHRF
jgi:hypothetical protein